LAGTRTRRRVTLPRAELPEGTWKTIVVGRREIVVVHAEGELRAVFNRCPHQQAPLARGRLAGAPAAGPVGELAYEPGTKVLRCPWHHYEFDLATGRCLADPTRLRVATYEARFEGEEVAIYV
jgi:nitrite reductase/ring-hydroxylating ferredoxin subunit